jgi:hypothetical protein
MIKYHCPDWAKERIWRNNKCGFPFDQYENDFDDEDTYWCAESQRIAEWLELDQIDVFPLDQQSYWLIEFFKAEKMIKSKGIRFFSDEV